MPTTPNRITEQLCGERVTRAIDRDAATHWCPTETTEQFSNTEELTPP